MATTPRPRTKNPRFERRFVLYGISWETYESLLKDLESSNIRLTYDQGSLEFMSPATPHERGKHRLRRMIDVITEELDIPVEGGGSTTFRRQLLKKGLEPDECYWMENAQVVREKEEIDLETDPPPDLAIEVENTRSAVDKLAVYAALGFPEVWRYDGKAIRVHLLQPDGTYQVRDQSPHFPFLDLADLVAFVRRGRKTDETTWIRGFRAWVRETLLPRYRQAGEGGPRP